MGELVHDENGEEAAEAELLGDFGVFELAKLFGDDVVIGMEADDGSGEGAFERVGLLTPR